MSHRHIDNQLLLYSQKADTYKRLLEQTSLQTGGARKYKQLKDEIVKAITFKEYEIEQKRINQIPRCGFIKTIIDSIETKESYLHVIKFCVRFIKSKFGELGQGSESDDEGVYQYLINCFYSLSKFIQMYVFDLKHSEYSEIVCKMEIYMLIGFLSFKNGYEIFQGNMIEQGKLPNPKNQFIMSVLFNDTELMNSLQRIRDKIFENLVKGSETQVPIPDLKEFCTSMDPELREYALMNFDVPKQRFLSVGKRQFSASFDQDKFIFIMYYTSKIALTQKNSSNWAVDGIKYTDLQISYPSNSHTCVDSCIKIDSRQSVKSNTDVIKDADKLVIEHHKGRAKILNSSNMLTSVIYMTETLDPYRYYAKLIQEFLVTNYETLMETNCSQIFVNMLSGYCVLVSLLTKQLIYMGNNTDTSKLNIGQLLNQNMSDMKTSANVTNIITQDAQTTFDNMIKTLKIKFPDLNLVIVQNLATYQTANLTIYGLGKDITPTYISDKDITFLQYFKTQDFAEKCAPVLKAFDLSKKLAENDQIIKEYAETIKGLEQAKQNVADIEEKAHEFDKKIQELFGIDAQYVTENVTDLSKSKSTDSFTNVCGLK